MDKNTINFEPDLPYAVNRGVTCLVFDVEPAKSDQKAEKACHVERDC